jgi:hypothetical protein
MSHVGPVATSESQTVPSAPKRLGVSIRALMLLVFVLAVWLGWRVRLAREQRSAVAAIKAYGGFVAYDWEFVGDKRMRGRSPYAPAWLRRVIGDEFFQDVTEVNLFFRLLRNGTIAPVDRKTDEVIPHLAAFSTLKRLTIQETQASDRAMETIGKLRRLEVLIMIHAAVTDEGIEKLKDLERLKTLRVSNVNVGGRGRLTDKTLESLAAIPHLQHLTAQGHQFTDRGLIHVQKMSELKSLEISNLDGLDISDAGLAHLKSLDKLERLAIQGSKVTDVGLNSLKHLKSLKELRIMNMGLSVSNESLRRLQRELPTLTSVR